MEFFEVSENFKYYNTPTPAKVKALMQKESLPGE